MFKNYLKISLRNLIKHKGASFINITGLAIGMACGMLILLFVKDELSYDRFHEKADRIYRVNSEFVEKGQTQRYSQTSPPIGPALQQNFPEIEAVVRVSYPNDKILITLGENSFYENQFYYADENLFRVFSFSLHEGNSETALKDVTSVVLSEPMARKYFGNASPLGKVLSVELRGKMKDFQVTGVLNKIPFNSHIRPDFIINFNNLSKGRLEEWWDFGFHTFVLLPESVVPGALEEKFYRFIKDRMPVSNSNESLPKLFLQPLADIHLYSDFEIGEGDFGPLTYVYLFSALALFIIAIACINFMNLATARSQGRAREVGVRKVVGAKRNQLIGQFLCESLVMSLVALVVAVGLIELVTPAFNAVYHKNITLNLSEDHLTILSFIILALIVGLAAGSYPALFHSRFQPIEVLKGTWTKGLAGSRFRKILVITQFAISTVIIFGTVIVYSQLQFVKNAKLGFDQEHTVIIPLTRAIKPSSETLKNEALRNPNVLHASLAFTYPAGENWWITGVLPEGTENIESRKRVYSFQTDFDFFKTLGATIVAGRDFSTRFLTDSNMFIINEAAVKDFGWKSPEEAIGKQLKWLGHGPDHPKTGAVIGVVQDFHFKALREKISPAVFHVMPSDSYELLALRIRPHSTSETMTSMKKLWTSLDPAHPFEYQFVDDNVSRQYEPEERLGKVFGIFAALAIFIACLGLYALVAFTTEQRTKEIGIRKVMGATIGGIVTLLSREFIKLVLIANVIAWPLAYWAMNRWLENFAYRVNIGISSFLLSAAVALLIALFTVSHQAFKAATANPVEALKYE